jgi:hypothetical protein
MLCKAPNHPQDQSRTKNIFINQRKGVEIIDTKKIAIQVIAMEV